MSSLFKGTGSAKVVNSEYFKPVDGLFRVDVCKSDQNRKKEPIVVIEGTIIHVIDPSVSELRAGDSVSQVLKPSSDYFARDVKAFVCSATSTDPNEADATEVEKAAAEIFESGNNPLSGTILHVRAHDITTEKGNPFTKITWKGEVDLKDAYEMLMESERARFFPNGV